MNISPLPTNKTVTLYSPLADNLVRTGTLKDGSCYFHSILHALSLTYRKMDNPTRKTLVKNIRNLISEKLTIEKWLTLGKGEIAKVSFQTTVLPFLSPYLKDHQISIKVFEDKILPSAFQFNEDIDTLITNLAKTLENKIPKIKDILKDCKRYCYNQYRQSLKELNSWIHVDTIEFISNYFNRDIYIIDAKTRMPYVLSGHNQLFKKRKSLIILWIDQCHYEILGTLQSNNTVIRQFEFNDPLIQQIYKLLSK